MNTSVLLILIFITITILEQNYYEIMNTNICHDNITAENFQSTNTDKH